MPYAVCMHGVPLHTVCGTCAQESDARVRERAAAAAETNVVCPKCGGATWDNRLSKRNPKAPDYRCRNRSCDGVIWPERRGASAVETALGLFVSVIKSGEPWSSTCEAALTAARQELRESYGRVHAGAEVSPGSVRRV
jgi:hypothetical protein